MKLAPKRLFGRSGSNGTGAPRKLERPSISTDAVADLAREIGQNRSELDHQRERNIVSLRNQAFHAADHPVPSGSPEQQDAIDGHRDKLRIEQGLPAMDAADLDPLAVRSAMLSHGSVIVRGLIDPDLAGRLCEGVDRAFDGRDGYGEGFAGGFKPSPWFDPFEPVGADEDRITGWGRFDPKVATVWLADSPRMMFELLEAFEAAGIRQLAEGYLGEPPAFSVGKSVMRRVAPDSGSAWHQDGAFLGENIRTLNIWTALNRCGDVSPGMDVVPKRIDEILPTGTDGAIFDWSVSPKVVEEAAAGTEIARPIFEAGDALLFDHMNLHGTGVDEGMTERRYATETWCFAPSAYPADAVPLMI